MKNAEILNVPHVPQPDTFSCGAACAMSVGLYFGVGPASLAEWREQLGTDSDQSTRPRRIVDYLCNLGLDAHGVEFLNIASLASATRYGAPVITPIQDGSFPDDSLQHGHYVVVVGVAGGCVAVVDPLVPVGGLSIARPGLCLIDAETFLRSWVDRDVDGRLYTHYGIAVSRKA